MKNQNRLSVIPGYEVDIETGESIALDLSRTVEQSKYKFHKIVSKYSQVDIDTTRLITSNLGEHATKSILGGKFGSNGNNKGHDLLMPDGTHMEVKIGRVGNSVVIKRAQLEYLGNKGFYSLVYYRTTDNLPPSHFVSKQTNLKPEVYLKRNIKIESMFIFPQPSIVMFYNTSNLAEGTIKSTGVKHKPLCLSRAIKLYNDNELGYEMYEDKVSYGKHQIQIYSLGYNIAISNILENIA